MINSVKSAIEKYNMIQKGAEVTVALSGGADSVSLLIALLELKSEYGFTLNAAHLNHCLRGQESDQDEQFVKDLCEKLGVELYCESADVKSAAKESGFSIELTAREIRYDFLNRVAKGVIATAHTADDNLETVLHNMVRGSGLLGITGIPAKRDNIIRPLILTERIKIEQYLAEKNIPYRVDSTNLEDIYTRNKIRHNVVTVLKEINSNAVGNVSRLTETVRDNVDFIDGVANSQYEKCFKNGGLLVESLKSLHKAVRNRVITKFYENFVGTVPERVHIELINSLIYGDKIRQSVQKDKFAVIKQGVLLIENGQEKITDYCFLIDELPFSYKGIKIYKESYENYKNKSIVNSLLLKSAVDYDKICGKLEVRNRKTGDKISLNGRNVTKTLKKLFNEAKIDVNLRDKLPVIADDNGILWVSGFGADSRAAVDSQTKTVLLIEIDLTEIKG